MSTWTARDVKDQNVQYPSRFKIDGVSHTIEPDFGTVTEAGTPINRAFLMVIENFLAGVLENISQDDAPTLGGCLNANYHTINGPEYDNGNSGTAKTIDWTKGNHQKVTMTGNCAFAFTNPSYPCSLTLAMVQDSTGGHTMNFPSGLRWSRGVAPSWVTTANADNLLSLYWNGSYYRVMPGIDFKALT